MVNHVKLMEVLERYNGQPLERGKKDCHLMVFEIFEPLAADLIKGRYTTAVGAMRVGAKYLGDNNIKDLLLNTLEYEMIDNPKMIHIGDIVVHHDNKQDVYLSMGYGYVFGVDSDGKFKKLPSQDLTNHYIFRKIKEV